MRTRVIMPIVLAAAAGVGCVMLLMPMLSANRNQFDIKDNSVPVVVASSNLPVANAITETMVRVVAMPAELVPPGGVVPGTPEGPA